jgi:L-asparaginase II
LSATVHIWRGGLIESAHRVVIAVVDGQGRLRAQAGNIEHVTFARSAIKPMQAIPLIEDGVASRFGMTRRELALCCASHNAEPRHVEGVIALLKRFGITPDALACGPHMPLGEQAARSLRASGRQPDRVHNNCSGKHAGMLGLALTNGWPLEGYHESGHPVQQRMLREMSRWTGVEESAIPIAVDGCGVTTFALSVSAMAKGFAMLARAARQKESAAAILLEAMARHPDYVAGENRLCSALMGAVAGRIIAKVGAEGVYCAAVPGADLGIALKVMDGATRAAEPALLAVLHRLGLVTAAELASLTRWVEPAVMNTRGERVGSIRVSLELGPL